MIGDQGCLKLAKEHNPNLEEVILGKSDIHQLGQNNIGPQGCSHLNKGHWLDLK